MHESVDYSIRKVTIPPGLRNSLTGLGSRLVRMECLEKYKITYIKPSWE